ncbi:hypothetical protein [[Flexibacter] sp. ATCC 35208]|uniref:hypothetical protein n=1 Tax=[Flexibacter] sp. ATCC 35208 TaxID=1936242 RepID=UPI00117C46FC|nr:hypothetical protein [[Flexibacter] sp. ATCC 35208]
MRIKPAGKNVKPHHVALYLNLVLMWQEQLDNPVILVKLQELMDASNIGSRKAYFRYMKELHEWGYISGYKKVINGANVVMKFLQEPTDDSIVS